MNPSNAGWQVDGSGAATARAGGSIREQGAIVKDDLRELARTTGEAVRGLAHDARVQAKVGLRKGKQGLTTARTKAGWYVAENPFKAVLVGLGAGALLGVLFSKRG